MAEKYTKRTFIEEVLGIENLPETVKNYAQNELEKLDKANERRRNAQKKPSKTLEENKPIMDAIVQFFNDLDDGETTAKAKAIAPVIGQTVQKTSAVLKQMVGMNTIIRIEPPKRSQSIEYRLPTNDEVGNVEETATE